MKEADTKECLLYGYIYMKFLWCLGVLWNDGSVLYLNCGGSSMRIHICQIPIDYILKMGTFCECTLYLNIVGLKIYKAVLSNRDQPIPSNVAEKQGEDKWKKPNWV